MSEYYENVWVWVVVFLFIFLGLPAVIHVSAKMWTHGALRGRKLFEEEEQREREGKT